MAQIKAIETAYNGYKFRSRLEARWAVFFDQIGLSYYYEYEGFDLDGLWYLPDFYIPKWKAFIEIKPPIEDQLELEDALIRCILLNVLFKKKVLLISGGYASNKDPLFYFFFTGKNEHFYELLPIVGSGMFGKHKDLEVLFLKKATVASKYYIEYFNRIMPAGDILNLTKPPERTEGEALKEVQEEVERLINKGVSLDDIEFKKKDILIPLDHYIGYNFALMKDDDSKTLAPFSHPFFCNVNAPFFNRFKLHSKAYNFAKQMRF